MALSVHGFQSFEPRFHTEIKTKSNYKTLNFVFQFIKNMKWHFGYTDSFSFEIPENSHEHII